LSMRYDVRGNLIHLTSISKFLNIPMVDLVKKRDKPIQNKLLIRVKKRLNLKKARKLAMPSREKKKLSVNDASKLPSFNKHRGEELHEYMDEMPDEKNENLKDDEEKISMISNHEEADRVSILKLEQIVDEQIDDVHGTFLKYCK